MVRTVQKTLLVEKKLKARLAEHKHTLRAGKMQTSITKKLICYRCYIHMWDTQIKAD